MTKHSAACFGEPIDDGRHGPYKSHFVCFKCRKVFKPHVQRGQSPNCQEVRCCPDCGSELWNCGTQFRAPRRRDVRAWRRLQERVTTRSQYQRGDSRRRGARLLREFKQRS